MLICGSRRAMSDSKLKDLYFRLIPVVYVQVEQLPDEFFSENDAENNFITRCMHDLIANALEPEVCQPIRARVQKLQGLLVTKFGFKAV